MLDFLIDNIFVEFCEFSTDSWHSNERKLCSPTKQLVFYSYENRTHPNTNKKKWATSLNFNFRNIDNVLELINPTFSKHLDQMYKN